MRAAYYISILVGITSMCQAARILAVFPTPSISHQVVFRPLTRELAKRGHEVVVITTDPAYKKEEAPENLIEVDVHDITYKMWREQILTSTTTTGRSKDFFNQMSIILPLQSTIFEVSMLTDQVKNVINKTTNHYDLILVEASVRPAISLAHVFKAPAIFVSSYTGVFRNYDLLGAPMRPVLHYPTFIRQRIHNLSLYEKLTEIYNNYIFEQLYTEIEIESSAIAKRLFGPDTPTIAQIEGETARMLLVNCHHIWEFNRPVPPNIIYMGGIHQNPSKKLPKELQSYLDSSKHGVIYVSFGTNVDPGNFDPERIQVLTRVFSKLPYDVLWKWNQDELPGRSHNIRISKWLPQSDLLRHPKVRLFIMQGGLQSTDEAITAGVPLIGIPFLGDQYYNVEHYVYHKIGIRLDFETLTEETLTNAIQTIMNDDSYRENIVRLGGIMRDQPEPPLQRAAWWVEHVLRHGGAPHLRATVANMAWTDYLDLPLMATLAALSLAALATLCVSLYTVISLLRKIVIDKQEKLFFNVKLKST